MTATSSSFLVPTVTPPDPQNSSAQYQSCKGNNAKGIGDTVVDQRGQGSENTKDRSAKPSVS